MNKLPLTSLPECNFPPTDYNRKLYVRLNEILNTYRDRINTLIDNATPEIDVFLIAGQSNAVGHGDSTLSPSVPTGKVLQISGSVLSDANDPVGTGSNAANTGSAWPSFGLAYYNATGRKICFVPKAVDSSAQAAANDTGAGNWDASGALYSAATTALDTALTDLASYGYTPIFRGVLWGQAETDALPASNQTIYQAALEAMLVRFRAAYGATMPFYMFEVGTDDPPTSGFATVRAAQLAVAAADPYTTIIFRNAQDFITRGLMADTYHYTQAGYNEMGHIGAANVVSSRAYSDWQRNALTTNDIYYTGNAAISGTLDPQGGLIGTATNDAATSGIVGEYIESVVSTFANIPATTVYGDITSITLSAGDWDVDCFAMTQVNTGTGYTDFAMGIATTSGTTWTGATYADTFAQVSIAGASGIIFHPVTLPTKRISIASSATYYLKHFGVYSGGNPQAVGKISARRIR